MDRAALLERLGDDGAACQEIIALFLRDAPNQICSLQEATDRGDAASVQRLAHTLNGASANIGATRLEKVARQMEKSAEKDDLKRVADLLVEIRVEFQALTMVLPSKRGDVL